MSRVHVIGAGLAGLSAAVRLTDAGKDVVVHEQAGHAGGRARSFHDATLNTEIDNGNHLLLSGNSSALDYLDIINARDRLVGPRSARFDFFDLDTKERWSIDLTRGPVPLWVLYKNRRVPGTSMSDYLRGLKLLTAGDRSVAALFGDQGQIYRRFWEPFSVAVLNTPADTAAARLLMPVIRETLAKGADSSKPLIAKSGLSNTFVEPAIKWLNRRGATIRLNAGIDEVVHNGRRVTALVSDAIVHTLEADEGVVLATPPWAAAKLINGISVPDQFAPIVNVHFRLETSELPMMQSPILGMVGSVSHWIFKRGNIVSVTISAADALAKMPNDQIAETVWGEVRQAIDQPDGAQPPVRVIKERRATFVATPAQLAKRPACQTDFVNLVLAGDWVDTHLPATIEGAIRSGSTAVETLGQLTD